MATQWFGSYADGLVFKIESTFNEDTGKTTFKVTVLEGSLDMNAMFWSDGNGVGGESDLQGDWNTQTTKKGTVEADITADGTMKFVGSDSALNMNGSGETWDGGIKLSNAGLGSGDKDTFSDNWELDDDGNPTFSFDAIGDLTGFLLGVRGTSTSTEDGSIKYVGSDLPPEGPPPAPDHFPDFKDATGKDISHVTFYFDTPDGFEFDKSGDIWDEVIGFKGNGDPKITTHNDPDGWFTVKFDVAGEGVSNDLDDWADDALTAIYLKYGDLSGYLEGVSVKGGSDNENSNSGGVELWYEFDNNPNDDDSADAPSVWIVENKEVDVAGTVSFDGTDYIVTI